MTISIEVEGLETLAESLCTIEGSSYIQKNADKFMARILDKSIFWFALCHHFESGKANGLLKEILAEMKPDDLQDFVEDYGDEGWFKGFLNIMNQTECTQEITPSQVS